MEWLIWIAGIFVVWIVISMIKQSVKRKDLMEKYGDEELVERLMAGKVWQGMPEEQLLDSMGKPAGMDQSVLKTKIKETWKYEHEGANRYALRIIVEDGLVVGWKRKGN